MAETKEWIIQRCTQRWVGTELIYEDFPTSEGLMTREEMVLVLDRVNRENPGDEFKGHRVSPAPKLTITEPAADSAPKRAEGQPTPEQVNAEIELVRGWYEGHPESSVIEELAARSARFQSQQRAAQAQLPSANHPLLNTLALIEERIKQCFDDLPDYIKYIAVMARGAIRSAEEQPQRLSDGVALIAVERQRQISAEGWTPEHDDKHALGELIGGASTYLQHAWSQANEDVPPPATGGYGHWPWDMKWWKPSPNPVRNLVKAGALIAAEIDRLRRIEEAR